MFRNKISKPIKERLLSKREIKPSPDGRFQDCWYWTGYSSYNYGRITYNGRLMLVHRLSLHIFKGFDLNSGLLALHHCDNSKCFNPNHLFSGTFKDNTQDAMNKNRMVTQKGENNKWAKLVEDDVIYIRKNLKRFKVKDFVKIFNVSQNTIYSVINNKTWRHI